MSWIKDPRVLWMIGAVALLAGGIGSLAIGASVGLLISLMAASLGYSQEQAIIVTLYAGILWVPLGFGMGIATALKFVKGAKALDASAKQPLKD